ncbi:unnamed protein product [Cuscuta epithymum]|uniref:Uncharacterized protein n=1 Tax=Cuscuta epithymum TaxID=186058 RepID=A0AAV0GFC4_9ASTE|nr:unnamed protein product [Cuscuta epithymum]
MPRGGKAKKKTTPVPTKSSSRLKAIAQAKKVGDAALDEVIHSEEDSSRGDATYQPTNDISSSSNEPMENKGEHNEVNSTHISQDIVEPFIGGDMDKVVTIIEEVVVPINVLMRSRLL